MTTPDRETENTFLKRLQRFFKRDKRRVPKQKVEITSEERDKRAFSISIGTGIFFLVIGVIYALGTKTEITISDTRVSASLIAVASFFSAWLARRGRSSLGIGIFLIAFYGTTVISVLGIAGAGIAVSAFVLSITLAITSAVMPANVARRVNIIALIYCVFPVAMDLFEPFPRKVDPNTGPTFVLVIICVVIYSIVIARRFSGYNIRTKLIIAFGAVTILPLISLAFYANTRLSDTLYQEARETLGQFASETASRVDNLIESQRIAVDVQSQNPSLIQLLTMSSSQRTGSIEESNVHDALDAFAKHDKFINSYALLDEQRNLVLGDKSSDDQINFIEQAISKTQVLVTGPFVNQKNGRASLYFSAPVKNQDAIVVGALIVEYDANIIEGLVESLIPAGNPKSILFSVVDANNFILIANTKNPKLLYKSFKNFTPAEVVSLQKQRLLFPGSLDDALITESETVDGLENINQSPFFTTVADKTLQTKDLNSGVALKNIPWLVFVRQSEAVVLTPVVEQRRTTTLIFLFLLTLVTLAAFGLSQLLASPILELAATAQKIAAGDLSLQSDITSEDEIGTLARAFNEMTRQSRALIDSLEQRSKALATSSEVSRRISTILDQQELVTEVVKQVQSAFGYYHAHIYLLDENTKELVMAGGTGEAGKAMLARGHRIPVGRGLVGRAAQNNVTVLVADVAKDPQWLPNPLLPDTRSEVAVPISIADRVLGVLDVQHNEAGTLKQEDVDVLQSIANQVAFAVRNARSYSDVQAKADRESLITSIGQKIQGTITVESAIQVAIREIGRALNGAKTQIVLNEDVNGTNKQKSEDIVSQP